MIRAASRGHDSSSDSSSGRPAMRHRAWRFPLLAGAEPWQDDDDEHDPASPIDVDNAGDNYDDENEWVHANGEELCPVTDI